MSRKRRGPRVIQNTFRTHKGLVAVLAEDAPKHSTHPKTYRVVGVSEKGVVVARTFTDSEHKRFLSNVYRVSVRRRGNRCIWDGAVAGDSSDVREGDTIVVFECLKGTRWFVFRRCSVSSEG